MIDFRRILKVRASWGRIPKGILLVGPPGRAIPPCQGRSGGERRPLLQHQRSEFVAMFVAWALPGAGPLRPGQTECPLIIFHRRAGRLGKARGFGAMGGHDEREQTLNQLHVEMDGFDQSRRHLRPPRTDRDLDPALQGRRFDRHGPVDGRTGGAGGHPEGPPEENKTAPTWDSGAPRRHDAGDGGADLATGGTRRPCWRSEGQWM